MFVYHTRVSSSQWGYLDLETGTALGTDRTQDDMFVAVKSKVKVLQTG
jgi:hypothetical protein